MKIVTFNLRMENPADGPHRFTARRKTIVERIRAEHPDILGFQEALPAMYAYLQEALPEYTFVGHGRGADYLDEANPIAFRRDRFALKGYATRWLSPTPEVPGSRFPEDQSICPRIFVTTELYDRRTGQVFRVVNAHLDHEGPIARRRGLALIAEQLRPDVPTVLMGDFNCPPSEKTLEPLRGRMVDQSADIPLTFHAFQGYYNWKQDKIDYIFTTPEFRRDSGGIWANGPDGVCLSDHYPVCFQGAITAKLQCVWEHNGEDTLLWSVDCPGAYARGESLDAALEKLEPEVRSWLAWAGRPVPEGFQPEVVQEAPCGLAVRDADSDVLFDAEREPLTREQYEGLKALVLRSAEEFLARYEAIPDKDRSAAPQRTTFYGTVPRTAREMYEHTKNVNAYYFGEIGVEADNDGDILSCRRRGFEALESQPDFLENRVFDGSWGESWTLRKLLRRFLWHDRIHGKAMARMAMRTFGI